MSAFRVEEIADGVWGFVGVVRPGPGARIDTRAVALTLPDGDVMVWSPLDFDDETAACIDGLGRVRHLVAPNLFHHLYLDRAQLRWPRATAWAPEGLTEKRPGLAVDRTLGAGGAMSPEQADENRWADWPEGVTALPIDGMPSFREWVFLHRSSRTLLVADLVFHRPTAHNAFTRLFFRLAGTYERFAQSRLFLSFVRDKPAYRHSLEAVLKLDFDRLVMAHGEVVERNAAERLAAALKR